ncbi:MAG: hypothetical protein M3R50_06240 [Bacteroidota bacterium]|nr:hypothetical protein [Bacteroidota bacterium]
MSDNFLGAAFFTTGLAGFLTRDFEIGLAAFFAVATGFEAGFLVTAFLTTDFLAVLALAAFFATGPAFLTTGLVDLFTTLFAFFF